jgi:hypothetical protein
MCLIEAKNEASNDRIASSVLRGKETKAQQGKDKMLRCKEMWAIPLMKDAGTEDARHEDR